MRSVLANASSEHRKAALLVYYGLICVCVFRRVKDHHNLLEYSPLLKNTCVRRVVLDKWFPLSIGRTFDHAHRPYRYRRPRKTGASGEDGG